MQQCQQLSSGCPRPSHMPSTGSNSNGPLDVAADGEEASPYALYEEIEPGWFHFWVLIMAGAG